MGGHLSIVYGWAGEGHHTWQASFKPPIQFPERAALGRVKFSDVAFKVTATARHAPHPL